MNYEYRDPNQLSIHRELKAMPRLANDDERMVAWRRGMKRSGPDAREILITAENEIVDGRHWFWNAKTLAWPKVRVKVVKEDEVMAIIFETLANRKHYTKGQLAYLLAPMLEEMVSEAKNRSLSNLKRGATAPDPHSVRIGEQTPEEIAVELGISYRVLLQASELHTTYWPDTTPRTITDRDGNKEANTTFKKFFEPRILMAEDPEDKHTRPYGLGAVLTAVKQINAQEHNRKIGHEHGGGRPEKVGKQLSLFGDAMRGLKNKFIYWQKWEPETRKAALNELPPVVEQMPDDLLAEFARVIKTELKRREK
jgi:hypothetical protein